MMKNINSSFNVKVIGQKKELSLEENRILFPYSRKFRFPFELKRSRIKETLKSHSYIREGGRYFTEIVRERRRRGGEEKKGDAIENGSMQSYRGTATFVIVEAPSKIALTRFSFQFPFLPSPCIRH